MIKVKIDKNTRTADIIDDSESTPGVSRTLTEFRLHVIPQLNAIMQTYCDKTSLDWMVDLYTQMFKGEELSFTAVGIYEEDDNGITMDFDLYDDTPCVRQLSEASIGQYILALIGGLVGGMVGSLLF